MAIGMPDRIQQIGASITPATPNQEAILYLPSQATLLGTNIRYQGYMAVVRCLAYIDSVQEVFSPVILPTDTLNQKEQKLQLFRQNPKKGLLISLANPTTNQSIRVGFIDLYNVKPAFQTGINEFFSAFQVYGIEFGWQLHVKVVDRGWGLLQNNTSPLQNDWVDISGYVEEKSSILQDHNNVIYNFVGV
jgi:hypothetical protein